MNLIQKITATAKAAWYSLPHQVQAVIVVFAAAASASLGKKLLDPAACWQFACLKQYVGTAAGAGLVALRAFYMRPGPGPSARSSSGS